MIERFALPLLVGAAAALALFWWADANGYTRAQAECQRKAQAAAAILDALAALL